MLPRTVRRAFTLMELLLVMIILGILAAAIVPIFLHRSADARITRAKSDISNLQTALDAFELDTGRYPTDQEGLQALMTAPSGLSNLHEPYLQRAIPNDPWNNPYVYHCPGQHNTSTYDLYSVGPDGQDGTADDIDNWSAAN